jgi:hypothetical protein
MSRRLFLGASASIVRSAIDRGLTFMDNAWDYNDGHSEERMGRALLHYAMNLPTSVMITGCDSMGVLDQAIAAALASRPLSTYEIQGLLARTAEAAAAGKYERFKTSDYFDSTAKHPHWLEDAKI